MQEVVQEQQQHGLYRTQQFVGKTVEVLIEKESKISEHWSGRINKTLWLFSQRKLSVGDFVNVKSKVVLCNSNW
ncbi:MAG: hypothetical protein CM15mP83_4280 [Flavobacteriaceae bacterium]|nr:MAG: hypothetical protein CM15mP83_4280 [Flavobacteriaceae bacterium]